jgi:hypothetical protein
MAPPCAIRGRRSDAILRKRGPPSLKDGEDLRGTTLVRREPSVGAHPRSIAITGDSRRACNRARCGGATFGTTALQRLAAGDLCLCEASLVPTLLTEPDGIWLSWSVASVGDRVNTHVFGRELNVIRGHTRAKPPKWVIGLTHLGPAILNATTRMLSTSAISSSIRLPRKS